MQPAARVLGQALQVWAPQVWAPVQARLASADRQTDRPGPAPPGRVLLVQEPQGRGLREQEPQEPAWRVWADQQTDHPARALREPGRQGRGPASPASAAHQTDHPALEPQAVLVLAPGQEQPALVQELRVPPGQEPEPAGAHQTDRPALAQVPVRLALERQVLVRQTDQPALAQVPVPVRLEQEQQVPALVLVRRTDRQEQAPEPGRVQPVQVQPGRVLVLD